jgi:site-specific DNA recombinase
MQRRGPGPLRAAIYIRVSGDEQARKGYSLDAQERACLGFAEAKGWAVVEVYRDEGKSPYKRDVRRPQFDRMMAEMDRWDVILTKWLSRLHRRALRLLAFAEELEANGMDMASVSESFDSTTPMGKAFMGFMAVINQLESAQTSERV